LRLERSPGVYIIAMTRMLATGLAFNAHLMALADGLFHSGMVSRKLHWPMREITAYKIQTSKSAINENCFWSHSSSL